MESNYSVIMSHVAFHEGGYTDNKKDPGGATNKGVIQRVYDAYRRSKGLMARHVKVIDQAEVEEIYRTRYWTLIQGGKLPDGIDYCTMDACVNSGVSQAGKWLQRAINKQKSNHAPLTVDGEIGIATLDRAEDYNPVVIIDAMCDERLAFMKIIRHKKTNELLWSTFGPGWLNRVEGYKDKTGKRVGGVRQWSKEIAKQAAIIKPIVDKAKEELGVEIKPTKAEKPVVPTYTTEKPGTGPVPLALAIIGAIIFAIWKALS